MKWIVTIMVMTLVCLPAWAGTLRDDFDTSAFRYWKLHSVCIGRNAGGERSVKVEGGVAKIKDDSLCSLISSIGLYRLEPWTDYELTAKLKVIHFKHDFGAVTILVRAQHCSESPCRDGIPNGGNNIGFKSKPFLLIRPANIQFNMQPANIILDHWYEVKVIVKRQNATYFFDGQKVKEEDIESATGGVAFLGSHVEFWLDYVEVSGDDVDVSDVNPKSKLTTTWGKIKASK